MRRWRVALGPFLAASLAVLTALAPAPCAAVDDIPFDVPRAALSEEASAALSIEVAVAETSEPGTVAVACVVRNVSEGDLVGMLVEDSRTGATTPTTPVGRIAPGACETVTIEAPMSEAATWTVRATATAGGRRHAATATASWSPEDEGDPAVSIAAVTDPGQTGGAPSVAPPAAKPSAATAGGHDLFAPAGIRMSAAPAPPLAAATAKAGPDLVIAESVSPAQAQPGALVSYTIAVRNHGSGTASDVRVVDDYDERYLAIMSAGGGTVASGRIAWDLGDLSSAEGTKTLTYRARVAAATPASVKGIDGAATVTSQGDTDSTDDRARVRLRLTHPDPDPTPSGAYAPADAVSGGIGGPDDLPYTGGPVGAFPLLAFGVALLGVALRALAHR